MDKHFLLLSSARQNLKIQLEDKLLCRVIVCSSMKSLACLKFAFYEPADCKTLIRGAILCTIWFRDIRQSCLLLSQSHQTALLVALLCILIGVINQQSC